MVEKNSKRSITDDEIAIIKAMLVRGMSRTLIQSYFTNPDRPVNYGRTYNIEKGEYGPEVPAASDEELDRFLSSWKKVKSAPTDKLASDSLDIEKLSPTHPKRLQLLFRKDREIGWKVESGETDEVECKESFNKNSKILRTVVAFANNRGGYIIFGARDQTNVVTGLKNDRFEDTDIAQTSQWFRSSMDRIPRFEMTTHKVGRLKVGIIYVYQTSEWPVIATKNADKYLKGTIYFRYPGESCAIGASELRSKLAERDTNTRREAAQTVSQVIELGSEAGILNLENEEVSGKSGTFQIDENLLSKIKFIQEGRFEDTSGDPALKLIGDLYPTADSAIIRQAVPEEITDDQLYLTFLKQENVLAPLEYVRHGCHSAKKWLPLFHFVRCSGISNEVAAQMVKAEEPSYEHSQSNVIRRLKGLVTSYQAATGKSKETLEMILDGTVETPHDLITVSLYCNAACGMKVGQVSFGSIAENLLTCRTVLRNDQSQKSKNIRTIFNRACCRLDEIMFQDIE